MDYLRGKIKSRTPSSEDYTSDSWRNRSILRRRDDIYNTAYSRLNSSSLTRTTGLYSSRYKSPLASRKYSAGSSYSPSPLNSPSLVRARKSSVYDSLAKYDSGQTDIINDTARPEDDTNQDKKQEEEQINYKELYEKEKQEKEVRVL